MYPTLTYASEICCWEEAEKFNHTFISHLKRYFGLPKCTSEMALLWMTGLYPLQARLWKTGYNFWLKISELPENRLEKIALRALEMEKYSKSWYSEMICCFKKIGFDGNFAEWTPNDIRRNSNRFSDTVDRYFQDKFVSWRNLCSYKFLTESHTIFQRMTFLDSSRFHDRRTICRLYLRVINFEIVTGTRHKIEKSLRFCQFCIENLFVAKIGDEKHYLYTCPNYSEGRKHLCSNLGIDMGNMSNAITNPRSYTDCLHIARFIREFVRLPDTFQP